MIGGESMTKNKLKGFRVDFGEGIHKGYAIYQHKKHAEKSAMVSIQWKTQMK